MEFRGARKRVNRRAHRGHRGSRPRPQECSAVRHPGLNRREAKRVGESAEKAKEKDNGQREAGSPPLPLATPTRAPLEAGKGEGAWVVPGALRGARCDIA
jgi:hypothetical protein